MMLGAEEKPLKPANWQQEGEKIGVMVLEEGRYRQIRRMFQTIGNEVVTLNRFQIGKLVLNDLEAGAWRTLTPQEISQLTE